MRFNKWLVGIGLLILGGAINLQAGQTITGFSIYSGNGTALNPSNSWVVIPGELASQVYNPQANPNSSGPVKPQTTVTYLSARAFSVAPVTLTAYYSTNKQILGTNTVGATTLWFPWPNGTNGFQVNQTIVLSHTGTYVKLNEHLADEYNTVSALTGSLELYTNSSNVGGTTYQTVVTNVDITVANALVNSAFSNDIVYMMTPGATISIASQGTSTPTSYVGPGIIGGPRGEPFLLLLAPTSTPGTNTLDAATATFNN